MRVRFLVASVVVAVICSACHRAPLVATTATSPSRHFALVLEHSAGGWSAHCDMGCRWTDVTMSCSDCAVQLDATGIGLVGAAEHTTDGFAFVLSGKGAGWEAQGVTGVSWQTLSWDCGAAVCRARIDETGVRKG
jgi:hypothetical protein